MASSGKKSDKIQNPLETQLNEKYNFNNYILSDSNQDAYSAAFFVSYNPGEKLFNPLFIYGEDGLGKNHLANASGNAIKERFPEKNILCLTCKLFCKQCIEVLENNNWDRLVNWMQLVDIFILEDIQYLSGQTIAQELILVISGAFFRKGKQIIITADRMLIDMQGINLQLLSRFKAGMMVELHQPDNQIIISFLKK